MEGFVVFTINSNKGYIGEVIKNEEENYE